MKPLYFSAARKCQREIHFGRGHTNGDAVVYFPSGTGRFIQAI